MVSGREIESIVKIIADKVKPEKILLFGSYAAGNQGKESDLDLLVVKDSGLPRFKRAREIRKHLWGITGVPKDILVYTPKEIAEWENVKGAFITKVLANGKVLYENNKFNK